MGSSKKERELFITIFYIVLTTVIFAQDSLSSSVLDLAGHYLSWGWRLRSDILTFRNSPGSVIEYSSTLLRPGKLRSFGGM